jgi:hypothetical protein
LFVLTVERAFGPNLRRRGQEWPTRGRALRTFRFGSFPLRVSSVKR